MDRITSIVERIIGHTIDKEQPMTEAGLDSLGAVELHRVLESEFAMQLPATLAFDYPTPVALAQHIASFGAAEASYGESHDYMRSWLDLKLSIKLLKAEKSLK